MFFNEEANELCADYIRRKIRKTVKDPAVAAKLMPKGHHYGCKRQPLDTNYYETYNKDHIPSNLVVTPCALHNCLDIATCDPHRVSSADET
jgi:cation diffusion facilitator CzcD-associated flavoprotein CzcO